MLRSAAHRRVEFRLPVWLGGVFNFIIAAYTTRLCVLGLGHGGPAHGGIVKLSVVRCDSVRACFTYLLSGCGGYLLTHSEPSSMVKGRKLYLLSWLVLQ